MIMHREYAKIVDVKWTPRVNMLLVKCGHCDAVFEHRSDRWTVRCPSCQAQFGLAKMREEWRHGHDEE
jgi:hypothetical protein